MKNQDSPGSGRWLKTLGVLIILAALCSNEWVLEYAFSTDGHLDSPTRHRVRIMMAAAVVAGLLAIALRRPLEGAARRMLHRHPALAALLLGLCAALLVVLAIEGLYYSRMAFRARAENAVYSPPAFLPGTTAHASLTVDGRTIFDVAYTLDDSYRRLTPGSSADTSDRAILFFGGSFTFGEGVADDETLPSVVARRAPGWHIMNAAFPGHGPAQMLSQLQDESVLHNFEGKTLKLVFVFVPGHVRRAIGSMRVVTGWARHFPYYALEDGGPALAYRGTFTSGRPWRARLYSVLSKEAILKYYDVDIPVGIGDHHIAFVARMMAESRAIFEKRFKTDDFYVVIYPNHPRDEFDGGRLAPHLEREGVRFLDYSDFFAEGDDGDDRDDGDDGYWLEYDLHPAAKAHRRLGEQLANDLDLGGRRP